jgi:hypothetical protein
MEKWPIQPQTILGAVKDGGAAERNMKLACLKRVTYKVRCTCAWRIGND